eukprot:6265349-Amphidinium_carterae.2
MSYALAGDIQCVAPSGKTLGECHSPYYLRTLLCHTHTPSDNLKRSIVCSVLINAYVTSSRHQSKLIKNCADRFKMLLDVGGGAVPSEQLHHM